MRKHVKVDYYEYTKPPKGVKVLVKPTTDYMSGLKYFILKGVEYRKTEFGWLPKSGCSGLGKFENSDQLIERVGW